MTDRNPLPSDAPDPYEEELAARTDFSARERLTQKIELLREEFFRGILDTRDFGEMEKQMKTLKKRYESGELKYEQYVVDVLKVLNDFTVPLTRSMMQEYGIGDFTLSTYDFDDICLDFINAKSGERMLVDPDSIPEEMVELPMMAHEIGDGVTGTLEQTEKEQWYLKGKGKHGWTFPIADADMPYAREENRGKDIEATVHLGKVQGCRMIGS